MGIPNDQEQKTPYQIVLTSAPDGTWSADITQQFSKGAVLAAEGNYPVDLYYSRIDINGSSVMEKEVCTDRKELLESLNWLGSCRHIVEGLWSFDGDLPMSRELKDLFNTAYLQKFKQIEDVVPVADFEVISERPKASLNDLLQQAGARMKQSLSRDRHSIKDHEAER